MKQVIFFLCTLLCIGSVLGQTEDEVLAEAYLLYNSEKASWHATDILLEQFPGKRQQLGGYFSYTEAKSHSCVFFDRNEMPNVLLKISFDDAFNPEEAKIDTTIREFTSYEFDLYTIRNQAVLEMSQDTMFKQYQNTNFNPIPLITKKEKKVFVLTGPKVGGVVVFGNDYLLTFNKKNKLKSKKALHKNIIPIDYSEETEGAVTMHSHLKSTGALMTSTDVCTLMLYGKYSGWKQHIVISDKNVSFWDCDREELFVMTKKAWDKMSEDMESDE